MNRPPNKSDAPNPAIAPRILVGHPWRRVGDPSRSTKAMMCCARVCLFSASLLLAGCVTADFKVIDALHTGMSQAEAQTTIASYGFQRKDSVNRPESGWPTDRKFSSDLAWRAGLEESRLKERLSFAEFYPVYHGMLGYGELFLFYGEDGKLRSHYRHQIN